MAVNNEKYNTSAIGIEEIISAAKTKNENKYKSIEVKKLIEPETDLGNLLVTDINLIECRNFK